jgi:hypothetical protein
VKIPTGSPDIFRKPKGQPGKVDFALAVDRSASHLSPGLPGSIVRR